MGRALPQGPEADLLRDLLRPQGPGDVRALPHEALASGFLSRVAAVPALDRCLPALVGRLAAGGRLAELPAAERAEAEAISAWCARRVEAMQGVLLRIGAACVRERIPAYLLKGAALHGLLYADPTWRPAADVDLFVPGRFVVRFHKMVEALGFVPDAHSEARVTAFAHGGFRRPALIDLGYAAPGRDLAVEVKADPVAIGRPPAEIEPFEEGGTPSPVYLGLLVPSAEAMVVQQAMSLARKERPDLLAHAELAGVLFARRAELDPARALDLVRGEGLYGILRGVLADTEAAFPDTVPSGLFSRRGRPAGFTPPRIRRGTFARPRPETRATHFSFWLAPVLGGGHPLATLSWFRDRVLPPQPLLAALTDGRRGIAAWATRLLRLATASFRFSPDPADRDLAAPAS